MIINFKRLVKSFKVAFRGLFYAVKNENTFRAGVIIAAIVIFFTFYFPLPPVQKAIIFLTIFSVLGMELMNTQVERVTNIIEPNYNPGIRIIKDLAAGAVLLLVICAAVVAYFIFLPYIKSAIIGC